MGLWQLSIKANAAETDELTDLLFELGATSVAFADAGDSPIFEPSVADDVVWEVNLLTAVFDESIAAETILLSISQQYPDCLVDCEMEQIVEQAWERTCLDQFQPMQFGKHVWICPSWTTPPDPDAINILLDPGLAFGTGTHPTTALCLEWLDANPPIGKTVIDYGCGSGILAIASVKLGASSVWAVDHHEQALLATRENAKRNFISAAQLETLTPEQLPSVHVDVLIANILAQPLIQLASRLAGHVKVGGHIVLSGILPEQTQQIINAYSPYMTILDIHQRDEWVCIAGVLRRV
jgi:ribosomal protein L11 methyltransferase